ncbi:hypothetical protein [Flaviflexus ciconiae]
MASGPAKSPYGGLRTATVDPGAIREAWEKHSRALIGVVPPSPHPVTGRPYTWLTASAPAPLPAGLENTLTPHRAPVRRRYRARRRRGDIGPDTSAMSTLSRGR